MTRIDFYVLPDQQEDARNLFACRLTEKAFRQNLSVLLLATDSKQAEHLDQLLWRFQAESFLPHTLGQHDPSSRILITDDVSASPPLDLLINLSDGLPSGLDRFARMAEIVVQTPEVLGSTRSRYLRLKELGYEVKTHKLG